MSNELITQLRAMQEREYDTFGDIGDTTAGRAADALERLEGKIADAAHLVKTGGIEICRERQRAEAAEARVKELELKLVRQDEVAREACEAAVWKYGQERMELEARVAELEAELNKRTDAYMNEPHCCSGRECGCMGVTRFEQIVGEELGQRMATMREQNARLRAALHDALSVMPEGRMREAVKAKLNGEEAST